MRPPKGAAVVRLLPPLLLLFLVVGGARAAGRRISKRGARAFVFTQPVYNATISENARGKVFAEGDGPGNQKMGVHVVSDDGQVRFKIVQGDTRQYFKAHARIVGDFAFLRIRLHPQTDVMLNRELKDHYQFLIKATFRREGKRNLETTTVVNLRIVDQNDLTPLFLPSDYVAEVSEDTAPFSEITQVSASDADEGLNGQVYFSLAEASSDLAVHPVSGVVTSLRRLSAGQYSLTVRAEDRASRLFYGSAVGLGPGRPSSEAAVTVTVVKANIFPPTIAVESKPIDPYANKAQLVAVLRISDRDEKQHGTISRVLIASGPVSDLFVLKADVEENVYLLETLAGAKLPTDERVSVDIVAVDGGTPELSATVPVVVQLLDQSRPSIAFAREYAFAINESSPVHSILGFVTANVSKPHANLVKYSIVGDANTFRINEKTGLLYLNEPLDFERTTEYRVTVRAAVDGVNADANILVEVLDSNDNSPQFAEISVARHVIAVSRDTPVESTIATIAATDRDSDDNGRVSFRIANEEQTPFLIDHYTGEVKLRSPLPSAGVSHWKLLIRASDRGTPLQRESELTLWIYVNGTTKPKTESNPVRSAIPNLHAPSFDSELYEASVAEDALTGTVVSTVVATDADWGYAALVQYALQLDGNDLGHFTVDTLSGELRVLKPFTAPNTYDLVLIATDAGIPSKTTTTKIRVSATDINDHAPAFDRPVYRATVPEDGRVGTNVLQVTAVDADVGNNGTVRYRLATKTDDFKIDAESGVLSVTRPLDREIKEHYDLMITAYDLGSPSLSSDANASITVLDFNDNSPRCLQKVHKVQIAEDWPQGALLTCVGAEDPDAGDNGRLSFELDSTRSEKDLPFRIDATSGCVFIDSPQPLDFEKRPVYNLTVEVSDNGQPPFSTICSLLVELIDVNENLHPPLFDDFVLEASVLENEPIGSEVTTVTATDPDDPTGRVTYAIVGGDGLGLFAIDGRGTVRTTSTLDRETNAYYWLVIAARDTANVPLTSVVHLYISVNDTNDNAPRPDKPIYFASVAENSPENTVVVKVEATDADDPTGDVRYRISRGDPQSFFAIDPKTGYITTQGRRLLDRETSKEHELEVTISDRGEPRLSTPVLVIVTVTDTNDNPPVFKQPIYNFNVPSSDGDENGRRVPLCRVFAADADEGVNARLFYNITDGDGHFEIDEKGELSSTRALKGGQSFALTVQATDMGSPSKSATTRVMIDVVSTPPVKKNNRKPTLPAGDWSELHISDVDAVGETIGLIDASDPDDDVLWWSIVDGNINDTFSLRRDTGELLLAKPLDDTDVSAFDIEYAVGDGAETSRGKIKVHVSKSRQVRPEFSAVHYKAHMAESAPIGTTVAKVNAALAGLAGIANGELGAEKISYSLHSTDSPISGEKFRVDARTGNVVLVDKLDHEAQKSHHLIVAARYGSLVNLASVSIDVTDENDSPPRFISSHYEAKVLATAAIGTWIISIQAHDSDSAQNSALAYAISSGNELGMFSLDTATGAIVVEKQLSLDYPETMLAVRVTDGGQPPMSDTSTVRILTVMDETSPPRFLMDPYEFSVKESTPVGTQIGTVYAESAAGVRYKMEQPTIDEIEIHPASGAVFLARKLDREQSSYLNFTVVAVGSAGGSSSTRVQLTVVDSNDHAPVFAHASYGGSVLENMPAGTAVLTSDGSPLVVSATDADSGPNALVNYKIATPWADDYFSVDFGTGAIRTKVPLDFELTKSLTFAVLASDMGSPAMTSPVAAHVTVTVKDSNDEKPLLVPQQITATLALPTAKGVILARAKAIDFDSVGELRYSISDERTSRLFAIDRLHGTITVAAAASSQFTANEYNIPISVSDGIHSTEGTVTVTVVNYAKTAASSLRFKKSAYQVSVVENTTSTQPMSILTLTVVGAELGERITYRLLNPTEGFSLGGSSGELKTTGVPLDREKTPNVTLIVQARDQKVPPRIAQAVITVDINDTNDCAPRFVNLPYYAVVPLDSNVGEKVIKVNALDDDKGPNGQVRYSLIDSAGGRFTINSWDGRITVVKAFPQGMATQDFTLVVQAKDQGSPVLMARTEVNVSVVNRAMPVFKRRYYKSELSEATSVGSMVVTVSAESNVGGKIGYVIASGDFNHQFDVDFDTGAILVRKGLDREKIALYNLTVLAVDVGRDGIAAEAIVTLNVTDENDNAPRFANKTFDISVAESTPIGTIVHRLEATDADMDEGGAVTYRIEGADASDFNVDLQNGDLFVAKRLDFEKKSRYSFKVIASDGGQPSLSTEAVVVVNLIDVNDEAPVFAEFIFTSAVPDDAPSGHFIAKMDVIDADTVSSLEGGHRLLYSVMDGDGGNPLLEVEAHSGVVRLKRDVQDVDILAGRRKSVNVSATDGAFTTYANLQVNLAPTSSRSTPPRFEHATYSPGAKENDPVGTPVITVGATGGAPPLKYSFGGKDAAAWPVTIDADSGKVFTREVLDYEARREYRIPMMVEDAAGRKGFTTLLLNVLDVNDNAPVFVAKSYKATASTNATHGESVLIVLAVDPDAGDQVEYSVFDKDVNENLHQFFKMNNRRGILSVRRNLKPLEGQTLSFFVRATDRGNPPKQSEVAVELSVVDDATAVPKFSDELYHFSVAENAQVGTVVGRLRQDDASVVDGVRYSILSSPEALGQDMPFSVDPTTAALTVVKPLDRETKDEWRFSVSAATDRAVSVSVVTIRVDDVNDNAPMFETTYEKLTISEDAAVGTSVTVFSATDKDLNAAGKTIFSIEGPDAESGVFKVDGESGWLMVDKKLDREKKDLYEFVVRASDQGQPTPLSTVTRVVIAVTDANDCAPEFGSGKYQFKVDEGAQLGTVVGKISVVDGDLPPNNATKLFIVGGNERQLFGLRDSGDLFVQRSLRSARTAPHRLVIIASDDRHSTTAEAVVSVLPASDRPPQCEREFVELVVGEDAEVGAEVFLLVADDNDAGTGLKYSLIGDVDQQFAFTAKGALVIARPLDRESREEYALTLRATDVNGRSCASTVALTVADINDEAPVFQKPIYSIAVKENMNITDEEAFFLLNVKALDNDSGFGGKVKYSLKSDQGDDILRYFKMDELTGALLLVAPLDREDKLEYNVTVLATDSDPNTPKSSTALVVVQVVDVNDNPPMFDRVQYSVEMSEREAVGYEVVKVHAVGGDHAETVTYQLVAPASAIDYFQVSETSGAVTLRKTIDYEKQKQFTLTVEATDSGSPPLTASTTVEIAVLDANDHAPKFAQTLYQATVEENSKIGTKVVQVIARDADSGEFGRLSYRLTSGADEFAVDDNGWITVKSEIDRETMSAHRLTVEVSDGGRPPLSDSAAVVIAVADKNDNPPIFAECNLTAVVQEGGELGRQLLTTTISDADADPNAGPFRLKIEGAGSESFAFDQMTLKATARLVYAKKDIYLLTVTATDNGQPPMSSECPLTIYVREESKHPPELTPIHVTINSLMGEFPGALIAKAHATDKDARDMLRYGLVDRKEYFTLNSQSGEISARQGLQGGVHHLNVSVTDGRFTTVANFTVEVEPVDQDALDHAVSIRFAQVSPIAFVAGPKHQFEKAVARILNVRPKNVRIISLQAAEDASPKKERKRKKYRHRRQTSGSNDGPVKDLDVLFTVSKGKERGYYRPNFVRQRLEEQMTDLTRNEHLQVVNMATEVCRRDLCVRGDCRDRLWLDDVNFYSIVTEESAFVAPAHVRTYECICKDGYGGKKCDVPTNACSRDPCEGNLMCVPKENAIGFECVCPPGTTGANCQEQLCIDGDCARGGAISLDGNGYIQYTLANPFDRRLELAIEMRTVASDGVILYGRGVHDYHALELHGGYLEYRWDCGAGPGAAKLLDARVSDGKWHTVKISRRGRHSKLTLDDAFTVEGESPAGNDVINLRNNVGKLTFGAQVSDHPTLQGHEQVRRGFNGCFNRLYVDGFELPRSKQGLKLFNVEMGCRPAVGGVCGSVPCENFGSCVPTDDDDYRCSCHPRFSGRNCEIDLNPCAGDPCPTGIPCQSLFNDFFCRCPPGFTGKTCQMKGDFDECLSSPCGPFGVCISVPRGYVCNCTHGWSGQTCRDKPGSNLDANPWGWPITVFEVIIIAVVLIVLIVLACLIVCVCRRTGRYRYHKAPYVQNNNDLMLETQPHVHNPLVSRSGFGGKFDDVPPPLPPRGSRGFHPHRNSKLSNLESAQLTGLPTVQVRPLSIHDRGAGCENSSDSPNGSRHWRPVVGHENGDTPVSCRRAGERTNLASARNYGSAAEELEQLGRFGANDILRTFGKPLPAEDEANLNRRQRMNRQELLDGLDRLSIDTIERLKEQNHNVPDDDDRHRSLASSIQCLPMEDGENGVGHPSLADCSPTSGVQKRYHWDYTDWNSTMGNGKDENGCELPAGVSALDETDSEFLADDDRITIPPMSATGDFRRELLKLQQLTQEANETPLRRKSREEAASTSAKDSPTEYMTMKPLISQSRHLDKYLPKRRTPPDSTQSQRRPLLDTDADMTQSSDSDGADSCDAVVQYGFPSQKNRRRNKVEDSSEKALYDEPPRLGVDDADSPSRITSFKLQRAASSDAMQCSMEGQLSNPRSNSDMSGICDIDDSEYAPSEHGQAKIISKQTVV